MKLRSKVIWILISTASYFSVSAGNIVSYYPRLPCQKYCPYLYQNKITLECCSWMEKAGNCPSDSIETYDKSFNLESLHCFSDYHCPMGFKCCKEFNYPYTLCKLALFPSHCDGPVEIFTETNTLDYDDDYDEGTSGDASGESSTNDNSFSGSGSGNFDDGSGDDDEDEGSGSDLSEDFGSGVKKINNNNKEWIDDKDSFYFDDNVNKKRNDVKP